MDLVEGTLTVELRDFDESAVAKGFHDPAVLEKAELPQSTEYSDVICFYEAKVLILCRSKDDSFEPGKYGLPGGKIEEGETPRQGAVREFHEETGLNCSEGLIKGPNAGKSHYFFHNHKEADRTIVTEPTIILDESEHYQYKWMSIGEIRDSSPSLWLLDLHERLCSILNIEI